MSKTQVTNTFSAASGTKMFSRLLLFQTFSDLFFSIYPLLVYFTFHLFHLFPFKFTVVAKSVSGKAMSQRGVKQRKHTSSVIYSSQ